MPKSRDQNAYYRRLSPFDYRCCWINNLFDDHLKLRLSLLLARLRLKLLHAGLSHTQVTVPYHTHATGPSHTQATGPSHTQATGPSHTQATGPSHTQVTGPSHCLTLRLRLTHFSLRLILACLTLRSLAHLTLRLLAHLTLGLLACLTLRLLAHYELRHV